MADLVEKFDRFKSNLASEQRAKPNRKKDKIDDAVPAWEIGVGSTDKYRAGWDNIFGGKSRNSIPRQGATRLGGAEGDTLPDTTEDDLRGS